MMVFSQRATAEQVGTALAKKNLTLPITTLVALPYEYNTTSTASTSMLELLLFDATSADLDHWGSYAELLDLTLFGLINPRFLFWLA
jgi:hypothetical protein